MSSRFEYRTCEPQDLLVIYIYDPDPICFQVSTFRDKRAMTRL